MSSSSSSSRGFFLAMMAAFVVVVLCSTMPVRSAPAPSFLTYSGSGCPPGSVVPPVLTGFPPLTPPAGIVPGPAVGFTKFAVSTPSGRKSRSCKQCKLVMRLGVLPGAERVSFYSSTPSGSADLNGKSYVKVSMKQYYQGSTGSATGHVGVTGAFRGAFSKRTLCLPALFSPARRNAVLVSEVEVCVVKKGPSGKGSVSLKSIGHQLRFKA